jgi:hypothetical protein
MIVIEQITKPLAPDTFPLLNRLKLGDNETPSALPIYSPRFAGAHRRFVRRTALTAVLRHNYMCTWWHAVSA